MPNTTPQTAPPGALDDTPQPDYGILFGEFARFMQKEQYNHIEPMKDTTKKVMAAVLELAANTLEPAEAVKTVESLVKCYNGYLGTSYEWISSTNSHCLSVCFAGFKRPFVRIARDINTAIVLVNEDVMHAFKNQEQPKRLAPAKLRLEGKMKNVVSFLKELPISPLECSEVRDMEDQNITEAFLSQNETSDLRTEFAA